MKEVYYEIVASDIDLLSRDVEFKKAIKTLIDSIPTAEDVGNFKHYQELLKEFVEMEENGNNVDTVKREQLKIQLEQAKEQAFSKIKELKANTTETENGDRPLDIVKNFPVQMEKFTKIFEPLKRSKVDDSLEETLKEISSKLGLDYVRLRSFFKDYDETKQDDENSNAQNEDINSKNTIDLSLLNENIKTVPKLQSETSNRTKTEKTLEQLLSEIILDNSGTLTVDTLKNDYNRVKEIYKLWNVKDSVTINRWAQSKKGKLADSEIYEALAVMDRANELVTGGHKLRDTQILSILIFLKQKDKGQLSQIRTGEGKTTIVSILAAIKALQGRTVDVVTSNPVLAADGIKNRKLFYSLLCLTVSTNNLDESYKIGARSCYKDDIVYGCISNFQFDYLKDSFLGLGTRADRSFDTLILDEVDSMIIDNASHIAKLSGPFPGMECLKYVYINIWQTLYKAEDALVQEFQEKLKSKAQELQKLSNAENAQQLYDQFQNELKNSINERIKNYIKLTKPTKLDIIPSHIQDYADNSLDRWINSAIDAKFNYHEDEQYVIRIKNRERVVQPVDYANTGITLKNTIWQYGLHQFLQLKHNLRLTSESLTSCFISNLGYINKYGNQIFGLTGTLGSKAEQEFLSSIYNVGYAKIPTYKKKKFIEIDSEVVEDETFSAKIANDVRFKVDNGRAVLIICETIKDAKTIQKALKGRNISIKIYFDEENAHVTEEEIKPGEVVIATNIAGRGTDFKTSDKLENNKGLHVCVAFLPCNKRVEDQAFGRTARQGNHGTAQLIIKKSELEKLGIVSYNFAYIKYIRDQQERERIQQIKKIKIPELNFQDKLFELFSTLHRKLQKEYQSRIEYRHVLDDLKEFWAFWLEKIFFKGLELANKSPEEEFRGFKVEACEIIKGRIQFNPYYSIKQAEYFLSLKENLEKEAEAALNHAISISKNPKILHSAYIKLFEIEIEKGYVLLDKFKKAIGDLFLISILKPNREYKKKAVNYLKLAKEALKKELDFIENLFEDKEFTNIIRNDTSDELVNTFPNELQKEENLFLKHLVSKQQALNLYANHIENLIHQIEKCEGGISLNSRISDYFANLKPQNDHEEKIKNTISNSELSELTAVGLNTVFALREVQNVCSEVIEGARIQISGGIAMIAAGLCFPPAIPITASIGGTMITEGICDVAIELISVNSDGKFDKAAYIKGKVISYGVHLLTMGIGAAMQCPKILNAARKACLWISETLRKCPFLRGVCEFLAKKFDKLGNWFEKMATIAKFNKMSKSEKLNYIYELEKSKDTKHLLYLGENLKQVEMILKELEAGKFTELICFDKSLSYFKQAAITTVKSKLEDTIMSKVVTPLMSLSMSNFKPLIRKNVDCSVRIYIDNHKLNCCTFEDVQNIVKDIRNSIDCETLKDIFQDAVLQIAKNCENWKAQLGALIIEQYISWKKICNFTKHLCEKINDKLEYTGNCKNENIDELINLLIELISEEMFVKVIDIVSSPFGTMFKKLHSEIISSDKN